MTFYGTKAACSIAWPSAAVEVAVGPWFAAAAAVLAGLWVLVWLRP